MRQEDAHRIVAARKHHGVFVTMGQVQHQADLSVAALARLAKADAFASLQLNRRHGTWEAMGLSDLPAPLFDHLISPTKAVTPLPAMPAHEEVIADYSMTGLSLKKHPVWFARGALSRWRVSTAAEIQDPARFPDGKIVRVAGLVLVRQRPGTASGVVFITLEDETGVSNLIVWSNIYERYHRATRHATLLQVNGIIQRQGPVIHVLAQRMIDRTELLAGLSQSSRDFH